MTSRRELLQTATAAVALLAHPFALGQGKVKVVGILSIADRQAARPALDAFLQGMRDLGWVQGQNIEYRMAFADGDVRQLDRLASELVAQEVDAIALAGGLEARAAQRATPSIPIVAATANAVALGLAKSLARPGGNITGLSNQNEEAIAKLVEVVHEAVPSARRFAVLVNESNPTHTTYWAGAQSACAVLGLEALRVTANAPAQLDDAVTQIVAKRTQLVVITGDLMYFSERARLLELLRPTRLPVGAALSEFASAGGLLSFGADTAHTLRRLASYVDKILKGARPADLPMEQPTKFELVLNLATAKTLGITLPQSLRVRADQVIE